LDSDGINGGSISREHTGQVAANGIRQVVEIVRRELPFASDGRGSPQFLGSPGGFLLAPETSGEDESEDEDRHTQDPL
jgi:hypothetical protein